MTNTNNKYAMVYKMDYAMALIQKGHRVFATQPNPRRQDLTMWVFEVDETFQRDFNELRGEYNGCR